MEEPDAGKSNTDNTEEEREQSHPHQPPEGALATHDGEPPIDNV